MLEKEKVFKEIEALLAELNIELKYARGYFRGGLVRYKEKSYLYLNRAGDIDTHLTILISELKKVDLTSVPVSSEIRELLK